MGIILIITMLIIAMRLFNNSNIVYEKLSYGFFGGLVGYSVEHIYWFTILCAALILLTEIYMLASTVFPGISLAALLGRLKPPTKKA